MSVTRVEALSLEFTLRSLINSVKQNGDDSSGDRLEAMLDKYSSKTLTAACCGCTSAGKSQLLNYLAGENLLPVSPLPSSANIVHIRPGKPKLVLSYSGTKPKTEHFPEKVLVHNCCLDQSVHAVEIHYPLPMEISLIDTPGIDSIGAGTSTANDLPLLGVDMVIYVTDYNHVQSETNFSALKVLEEKDIPYFLVVNQIDKHADWELSLKEFRHNLMQALKQWGLQPKGLFFTSLLDSDHPGNELRILTGAISGLSRDKEKTLCWTLARSVRQIIIEHGRFLIGKSSCERAPYLWATDEISSQQAAKTEVENLQARIERLESLADFITAEILKEMTVLLENAPLFNFETRELAQQFLLSRQPDFKAGFFAGSRKTEMERARRLERLHTELKTRSQAHLTWHLRQILARIPQCYDLPDTAFTAGISCLSVELPPKLLLEAIHPGAVVSNEYLLNYTKELAGRIKALYRQTALVWIDQARHLASAKAAHELPMLQSELAQLRLAIMDYHTLKQLEARDTARAARLQELWSQAVGELCLPFRAELEPETVELVSAAGARSTNLPKFSSRNRPGAAKVYTRYVHPKLAQAALGCSQTAHLTSELPGFNSVASALRQRAERLKNNLFTVALFGAFSSGKSSLANALL